MVVHTILKNDPLNLRELNFQELFNELEEIVEEIKEKEDECPEL